MVSVCSVLAIFCWVLLSCLPSGPAPLLSLDPQVCDASRTPLSSVNVGLLSAKLFSVISFGSSYHPGCEQITLSWEIPFPLIPWVHYFLNDTIIIILGNLFPPRPLLAFKTHPYGISSQREFLYLS